MLGIFFLTQNYGTLSMNFSLSIDEFWNLNRNCFHAKPWKTNTFDEICKLNGNFSMKLHLYRDNLHGKPPGVSTVLQYPWRKFINIKMKPRGFKKKLKNRGKAPSFPRFWIFNKCLWKNTYYILKTKKWIKYNTRKVIYRKEIYRESKIWEKTYWSKRKKK